MLIARAMEVVLVARNEDGWSVAACVLGGLTSTPALAIFISLADSAPVLPRTLMHVANAGVIITAWTYLFNVMFLLDPAHDVQWCVYTFGDARCQSVQSIIRTALVQVNIFLCKFLVRFYTRPGTGMILRPECFVSAIGHGSSLESNVNIQAGELALGLQSDTGGTDSDSALPASNP
jgi:hypothetical protein